MKKLSIKLNHDQLLALDAWIDSFVWEEPGRSSAERCAHLTLLLWWRTKVQPKTVFRPEPGDFHRFKLDAPTAFALQHAITHYGPDASGYLGNKLIMIQNDIDRHFTAAN